MKDNRKILLIQTAYIGDVILTTPLARAVKEGFEGSGVHFMLIPSTANLLENNPNVDKIIVYDKRGRDQGLVGLIKMLNIIKGEGYDLALIPHRSLRSALIPFLARVPCRIGFDTSAGAMFLTKRVAYRKDLHEVERNLELLSPLGLKVRGSKPEIYPDDRDVKLVDSLLTHWGVRSGDFLVGIAPGSVWLTKRWPGERFAQLAKELRRGDSVKVVLIGGEGDRELCERISKEVGWGVLNSAGRLSLRRSAELIKRCRVLVTNDTAPMHLACAVGTRVVAIFGPTVPEFGFYPYGDGHVIIQKELPCRPCGIHGGRRCPKKHFDCMRKISVEEVYRAVTEDLYNGL